MRLPSVITRSSRSMLSWTTSFMEHEAGPDAIFGDLEDGGLGAVQNRVGVFLRVQAPSAGSIAWRESSCAAATFL